MIKLAVIGRGMCVMTFGAKSFEALQESDARHHESQLRAHACPCRGYVNPELTIDLNGPFKSPSTREPDMPQLPTGFLPVSLHPAASSQQEKVSNSGLTMFT